MASYQALSESYATTGDVTVDSIRPADNPIFVVGPPRSGTTLTARILGSHSGIFMPGETQFFSDIYARRRDLGDPASDVEVRRRIIHRLTDLYRRYNALGDQARVDRLFAETDMAARLAEQTSYAAIFRTFMEARASFENKRRWGNQVPRDLFDLEKIFALYPDAKVIISIRHVLDYLTSYRDKWMRSQRENHVENVERLRRLYHPVVTSLLWKSSIKSVTAAADRWGDRVLISKYEDLVEDPEAHIARLCDFVGESYEPGMMANVANNSSREIAENGIFRSSVGRWQDSLSTAEIASVQMLCRREMQQFAYQPVSVDTPWISVAKYFVTTPAFMWRGLAANKGRHGPLVPYIAKRVAALIKR